MEDERTLNPNSLGTGDLMNQVVIPLSKACFRNLENLMGKGDWVAGLLSSYPRTRPARSAWKPLLHIRCQIDNAPGHLLEAGQPFQAEFEDADQMLDGICNDGHMEQKSTLLQREIRRFIIPACVAIIKAVFDGATVKDGEGLGFTRTRLGLVFKAVDWVYSLNSVVIGGVEAVAGDKEKLERAVGPLSEGILGAMTAILREESSERKVTRQVKGESIEVVVDTQLSEVSWSVHESLSPASTLPAFEDDGDTVIWDYDLPAADIKKETRTAPEPSVPAKRQRTPADSIEPPPTKRPRRNRTPPRTQNEFMGRVNNQTKSTKDSAKNERRATPVTPTRRSSRIQRLKELRGDDEFDHQFAIPEGIGDYRILTVTADNGDEFPVRMSNVYAPTVWDDIEEWALERQRRDAFK